MGGGWMDRWMKWWVGGRVDGWVEGWVGGWMDGGWVDDGWMDATLGSARRVWSSEEHLDLQELPGRFCLGLESFPAFHILSSTCIRSSQPACHASFFLLSFFVKG